MNDDPGDWSSGGTRGEGVTAAPVGGRAYPGLGAVLFDMDGLLLDSEHTWLAVETEVMAALGASWGPQHQRALVGGSLDRTVGYMLAVAGRTDVAALEVERMLLDGMVRATRTGPIHWMPGAERLVAEVGAAGVPRGLVSSSSRVVMAEVLDRIGGSHFDVTVSGDDVAQTKPHPDPYLLGARLLGVDPRSCVALEDSATGATSARAAGCLTIAVPSVAEVPDGIADLRVDSLERLDLAALAGLLAGRA